MSPTALRTRLLNLFTHLSATRSSFAEGDLVLDDPGAAIFHELCDNGMQISRTWWELTLSEPLTLLCPCLACTVRADYKSALRFRQHGEYVMLRLLKDPWHTLEGGMELARLALWGEPRIGLGCVGGWRSSESREYQNLCRHDMGMHEKAQTTDKWRLYSKTLRTGNELYVPACFWSIDAVKTTK